MTCCKDELYWVHWANRGARVNEPQSSFPGRAGNHTPILTISLLLSQFLIVHLEDTKINQRFSPRLNQNRGTDTFTISFLHYEAFTIFLSTRCIAPSPSLSSPSIFTWGPLNPQGYARWRSRRHESLLPYLLTITLPDLISQSQWGTYSMFVVLWWLSKGPACIRVKLSCKYMHIC